MGLNKKIARQIKKMPRYKINQEAFENQTIAKSRAFGRDRSIQMAEEDIEADASGAIAAAKDATSSTSGLLSAIASINSNTGAAKRELAQDESQIQRANVADLYGANNAMIDEKDKAWRQNKLAPWETKLKNMQQKKANRTAFVSNLAGGLLSAAGSYFGAGGGRSGSTQPSQVYNGVTE